jgi:hypothetical protein
MSAASRSFDVLLVSVLLVAVTRCQSIGCFNAGECAGGNINGFNEGIALARDCLEVCKDNTNCKVRKKSSFSQFVVGFFYEDHRN